MAGTLWKAPEGHWTFVPAPLPPVLHFTSELVQSISRAERALGELAGVGRMLPNAHLLIRPFARREAVLSSRIEGTVTKLQHLMLFEAQAEEIAEAPDANEVLNYVKAMDHGLELLTNGLPLCLRMLRELHRRLMQGVRGGDQRPGEFRNVSVLIGRSNQNYDEARFVPPHPSQLDPLLNDFERFLNNSGDLPIVVQLALAHYQFEAIHPFADGNGRVGRLLMTLMLCERRILPQPLLYLSAYLEHHDEEYRDHLLAISQRGTWAEWIRFFANGVAEQALDASSRARQLLDLQQTYRERIQRQSKTARLLQLIDHLFAWPFVTIAQVAAAIDVTAKAATANVEKLVNLGILESADPTRRWNRVFFAPEILRLLDAESALAPTSPDQNQNKPSRRPARLH